MAEAKPDVEALVKAPSPARRHRFVQTCCLATTLAHTAATLMCVFAFREGNFTEFSPQRLLQFVPQHLWVWRTCCLLVMGSSLSTLLFVLAMRDVLEEKFRSTVGVAVCLAIVACVLDLEGVSRMMVLFADIAMQGQINCTYLGADLVQIGWTIINQSITQTFMLSAFLYGAAGLCIVRCLSGTRFVPRYLAFAHLPVWLCMVVTAVVTFVGHLPAALCLMFAGNLGLSFLAAFTGVSIDSMLSASRADQKRAEDHAQLAPTANTGESP
jgi:hypothetical protein